MFNHKFIIMKKLSKSEMRQVSGGAESGSTCSTKCKDGTTISIKCTTGDCVASNGHFVECRDEYGKRKDCKEPLTGVAPLAFILSE